MINEVKMKFCESQEQLRNFYQALIEATMVPYVRPQYKTQAALFITLIQCKHYDDVKDIPVPALMPFYIFCIHENSTQEHIDALLHASDKLTLLQEIEDHELEGDFISVAALATGWMYGQPKARYQSAGLTLSDITKNARQFVESSELQTQFQDLATSRTSFVTLGHYVNEALEHAGFLRSESPRLGF